MVRPDSFLRERTMKRSSRREFLAEVGQGMLLASVGSALAVNLGLTSKAFAGETPKDRLTFGQMEPLVALMQDTPADKLLPEVVKRLQNGTELRTIVAAGALANARTFGGHDYDGYHTFMALTPSYQMALELPEDRRALPVLKVLHRNARFIQKMGGHEHEALHPVSTASNGENAGPVIQAATRKGDQAGAEGALAALSHNSLNDAYNELLYSVQDEVDVHRVVLAWRAWATLDITGKEQALTLLRQSVRFCIDSERGCIEKKRPIPGVRASLTKLLDQYKLLSRKPGDRKADDAWIEKMCQTIYAANREQAADAVAAALADGISPADIGEAISLAANRLVLRDPGRVQRNSDAQRPVGSVHGASVGVHASDSANAWRNIARVSNPRNSVASLIVAGYHTAGQAGMAGANPYPWAEHLQAVKADDSAGLLAEAEPAIKAKDQPRAAAIVHKYGEKGFSERPVFDLLLKFACSEDGALHAEKYYRTVTEEFATIRPAFRWRQLVALARVTASEYGFPAPGYADACKLLKV